MGYVLHVVVFSLFLRLYLLPCCLCDGGPSMFGKHFGGEVCSGNNCEKKVCLLW